MDARGVRIWLRQPDGVEVSGRLEVEGSEPVTASVRPTEATDWTAALELALPEPAPGRAYVCTVGGRRFTGRLAPEAGTRAGLTFGFGSCHQPFEEVRGGGLRLRPAAGIYPAALEHLRHVGAQRLLLLGDQLYSDMLPSLDIWRGLKGRGADAVSDAELLARYRQLARVFFGEPGFRALREAFPTSCMWDDHDIFDNWGSRLHQGALEQRLFAAASRAFCEYQHLRNPGGRLGPPPYGFHFVHGDLGFLVLDMRGARDHEEGRLFGRAQWEWLQGWLRGEEARRLQTLFVGLSVPIAHAARWMALAFDRLPGSSGDSVRDRWGSGHFLAGRDALLEALFTWQQEAPRRQVCLLSGDIHAASGSTVRQRGGRGVLHQFTSSALTTSIRPLMRLYSRVATRAPNVFERRWHFAHHFLTFENNLGVVQAEPLPAGGHRVTFEVRAWNPGRGELVPRGRMVVEPA